MSPGQLLFRVNPLTGSSRKCPDTRQDDLLDAIHIAKAAPAEPDDSSVDCI